MKDPGPGSNWGIMWAREPWERTPRWLFWKKPWRRWWSVAYGGHYEYADHADFLLK